MNVRRRSGQMGKTISLSIKNAVTQVHPAESQASMVKNAKGGPKACDVKKVNNAVNGPQSPKG